ncbi:hypothetical protein ACMFMG_002556 [Clarireedia jacksonii]
MYISTITASLLLFSTAYGAADTTTTTATTPSSTVSTSPSDPTHTILVGKDGLKFTPNVTVANAGTKLEFHFYPQAHSVAQASFADPCVPISNGTGFYSGLVPTTEGANVNVFTVDVNDTKPIWFYCGAQTHCEKGMVGAVNVPTDGSKTVEQFAAAAAKVSKTVNVESIQGGVLGPVAGGSNSTSTSGSGSGSGSGSSTTATGSSASASSSKGAGEPSARIGWMGVGAAVVGFGYLLGM